MPISLHLSSIISGSLFRCANMPGCGPHLALVSLRHFLYCLWLTVALYETCSAAGLVLPSLVSLGTGDSSSTNAAEGLVGTMFDLRYGYQTSYGGPRLPELPCFMSAVFFKRKLALEDFSGIITEDMTSRMYSYPEMQIAFSPYQPHLKIMRRFAIWGLFSAIYDMVLIDNSQNGTFLLVWERSQGVGYVRFMPWLTPERGPSIGDALKKSQNRY